MGDDHHARAQESPKSLPRGRRMMSNKDRKNEEELAHLFEALAESVLESSDADLLNELRAEGQDPDAVVQRASQLIQAAIKAAAEAQRREARQAYEASVASLK